MDGERLDVFGRMYGASDRRIHMARWVPNLSGPPRDPLCGRWAGLLTVPFLDRPVCEACAVLHQADGIPPETRAHD